MKKTIMFLIAFLLMSSVVSANEWTYLGKFMLPNNSNHCSDYLILNHLKPYQGQYNCDVFDVYYHHNHDTDFIGDGNDEGMGLNLQEKIVPLNSYGNRMNYSGVDCGTIISDVDVRTKGSFGVCPNSFRIFDNVTHKEIFSVKGEMRSEQLKKRCAAEYIVNVTAPHRGFNQISGSIL